MERMLKLFAYAHLEREDLLAVSKPFHDLAHQLVELVPAGPERTAGRMAGAGLRKGKVKSTDHRDVTFANPEIRALMTADKKVAGGFDNKGYRGHQGWPESGSLPRFLEVF